MPDSPSRPTFTVVRPPGVEGILDTARMNRPLSAESLAELARYIDQNPTELKRVYFTIQHVPDRHRMVIQLWRDIAERDGYLDKVITYIRQNGNPNFTKVDYWRNFNGERIPAIFLTKPDGPAKYRYFVEKLGMAFRAINQRLQQEHGISLDVDNAQYFMFGSLNFGMISLHPDKIDLVNRRWKMFDATSDADTIISFPDGRETVRFQESLHLPFDQDPPFIKGDGRQGSPGFYDIFRSELRPVREEMAAYLGMPLAHVKFNVNYGAPAVASEYGHALIDGDNCYDLMRRTATGIQQAAGF